MHRKNTPSVTWTARFGVLGQGVLIAASLGLVLTSFVALIAGLPSTLGDLCLDLLRTFFVTAIAVLGIYGCACLSQRFRNSTMEDKYFALRRLWTW